MGVSGVSGGVVELGKDLEWFFENMMSRKGLEMRVKGDSAWMMLKLRRVERLWVW